jgi:hypothetical protein
MKQPNAKEVMKMVGLKLLQGRQPGQSLGQQFGGAIGTGVMANSMMKENQAAEQDKLRKQGMEDEKHGLEVRRGTAMADQAEQENDFYSQTRSQALVEMNQKVANLKTAGRLAEANAIQQELDNANFPEAWRLTKLDKESAIRSREAQTKIGWANANKQPAAGQARQDLEDLVRRANPKQPGESDAAYDQRLAQATLGIQQTSKTNSAADLLKLAEFEEDDDKRAALLAEAEGLIRGRKPATAPAPTTGRGGTKSSGLKAYASEAAVAADFKAKKLQVGDVVLINGKKFRVTE